MTADRAPEGLSETEREDDGPECETCGKTLCPDADLPAFSEPRGCAYKPIYEALRDARDCDHGCARDYTNQAVRLEVVAAVGRILDARLAEQGAVIARVEALADDWDLDQNPHAAWLPIDFADAIRAALRPDPSAQGAGT